MHVLCMLKQRYGELKPWVSKKRGFHAVIPKAHRVQSSLKPLVGNLRHQRHSFPSHWNVNDKVWRDSTHFLASWCYCSDVALWELRRSSG